MNQTVMETIASIMGITECSLKLQSRYLFGSWGDLYCRLFDSNVNGATFVSVSNYGTMIIARALHQDCTSDISSQLPRTRGTARSTDLSLAVQVSDRVAGLYYHIWR